MPLDPIIYYLFNIIFYLLAAIAAETPNGVGRNLSVAFIGPLMQRLRLCTPQGNNSLDPIIYYLFNIIFYLLAAIAASIALAIMAQSAIAY